MNDRYPAGSGFSSTKAASSGFSLMMRHRGAVIAWSLWMLLVIVVGVAAVIGLIALAAAGDLQALVNADSLETLGPGTAFRVFAIAIPAVLLLIAASWAMSAIIMASVTRMILDSEAPAQPYLRIGGDEWRAFLVSFAYGLLYIVGMMVAMIGAALLWRAGWWAGLAFGAAATLLLIWTSVRLSLAVPLSIAMKRFDLFGSWSLTKGRFWPILGAFILAWLFLVVASIAAGMIGQAAMLSGFAGFAIDGEVGVATIIFGSIATVVYLAAQLIYTVMQTVVLAATPASIYREVGGSWQAEVF